MTNEEMQSKIKSGQAKLFCKVGLQNRPVYEIGSSLFEKSINFDDSIDHSDFNLVETEREQQLREIVSRLEKV